MNELPIIQRTYDLIRWYVPILNRLPRHHQFLLGNRIITGLYDLLDNLIKARYEQHKLPRLESLNSQLDILRYQTRLLLDFEQNTLRIKKYVRYVDDFALFSDDWECLQDARLAIENYLATLRLKIHPVKSQLFETRHGANFLGFRVHPMGDTFPKQVYIRVRRENLRRARQRLRQFQKDYAIGQLSLQDLVKSLQGWEAHLEHGDTWQLRQQIFTSLGFARR